MQNYISQSSPGGQSNSVRQLLLCLLQEQCFKVRSAGDFRSGFLLLEVAQLLHRAQ